MLTNNDLSAIKKIVKEEVKESEKRINANLSKVQESVDIVQGVVVKHYDRLDQRVAKLEEELRVPGN